jgi:hypothetical protein
MFKVCRPRTICGSLLAQPLVGLLHRLQGHSIDVCFVASKAKRKEKKNDLFTSNNVTKVTEGKFYSLYEDLKAHTQNFLSTVFFDR